MKILIVGATGAVGSRLVPMLVGAGHEVVGTTTRAAKVRRLQDAGAAGVVLDVLDRDAVRAAVRAAEPEVVVHQATSLSAMGGNPRRFAAGFTATNRLRTQGTDHLLVAVRETGVRRFVAQSFAGWPNGRTGGPVKTELDPLDAQPVPAMRPTLEAIEHLEDAVTGEGGLALRYGGFYGPGTSLAPGGAIAETIRRRQFPMIKPGTGIWSFIHIDDAASGTATAIERGEPGLYNIVDDEPAPVAEWLPYLAMVVGARPPLRLPAWLARLVLGEVGTVLMNEIRGSSNAKARRVLGWSPAYSRWREGFAAVFAARAWVDRKG